MEIYDTEEAQVEALKRWWKENSQSVVIGLVMGIALILGWNYWQDHKKQNLNKASLLFEQLQKAAEADKKDSVDKLAAQIKDQFGSTEYVGFSGLIQAKLKAQSGDLAGAKEILKAIAAGQNKELSNIAKLRLVRLMLATKEYEQGLQLINSIDPAAESSFSGNYDELTGDLYVALNRVDEARTAYQSAQRNGHQSPLLQYKIDDLATAESLAPKK
ncbi:YfgM family protein [Crenothrix sp.]|uniref:YfgM family protein n=1 Tax=Crenothrix sp. TaxID=3100433 RepID=UPI00374D18DE